MSQNVIIFQEDCILAAKGREGVMPSLDAVKKVDLQGLGDEYERWFQALGRLNKEFRIESAKIVLPANLCETRILQLPYAKGKQLKALLDKEFQEGFRSDITDYAMIKESQKTGNTICCGGVASGVLKKFSQMCEKAGITPEGLSVPMESYLRILQKVDNYQNEVAICLFFENGNVTSVLCENGEYKYSSRSRLFSEPGTLDFGTEIVRNISGILQFWATGKNEAQITKVYYAGCPTEDFEVSIDGIRNLNLEVGEMKAGGISVNGGFVGDWAGCLGALIKEGRKDKNIDFFEIERALIKAEENKPSPWRHVLFPVVVLILLLIPTVVLVLKNHSFDKKVQELTVWMEDEGREEDHEYVKSLEAKIAELNAAAESVETLKANLATYPSFNSSIIKKIENAGGNKITLNITGYDAGTGVLNFMAVSKEVDDLSDYILKIEETELFHKVNYSGYNLNEDGAYEVELACVLAGPAADNGGAE